MAGYLNRVMILGNVGNDLEKRHIADGVEVVNFSVATTEKWKDKNSGGDREKTEWHRVAIWNEGLGKVAMEYLKKGSKVYLSGKMETTKYEKDGIDRYSTQVVLSGYGCELILLGDPRGNGGERREERPGDRTPQRGARKSVQQDMDDEIPF